LGLAILLVAGAIGCGGRAELESQSIRNMEELAGAVWEYRESFGKYPEDLEDIEKFVGGGESFDRVIANPLTGDNPGYEYVKPPEDTPLTADPIIIYQLRNGQRDTRLTAFALDGTARSAEP
jgi:hypothetical protein